MKLFIETGGTTGIQLRSGRMIRAPVRGGCFGSGGYMSGSDGFDLAVPLCA
jgi:hypothetical protein